jgi:DNA-binding response OmpR family regulator
MPVARERTREPPSIAPREAEPARPLRVGNLEIIPAEYQVMVDGVRAGLTVREF